MMAWQAARAADPVRAAPRAVAVTTNAPGGNRYASGYRGFDTCTGHNNQPSTQQLQNFWNGTPYYNFYVYIGGYGNCGAEVNSGYISAANNIGYGLVPIWFGLQAPCGGGGISYDLNTAASQGVSTANSAISQAASDGFAGGAVIALDIESYDYGNQSCRWAVNSYVNGFDQQAYSQSPSWLPVIYATPSDARDWPGLPPQGIPFALWSADWGYQDNVWNLSYISNGSWSWDQRHSQYWPNYNVTYNGTNLTIDQDCANSDTDGHGSGDFDSGSEGGSNDPSEDPACN